MTLRTVRRLAAVFFLAYTVALTYPGMIPFNRIRPFILGLPASMVWVAVWIVLSILVLVGLDRAEEARREEEA